jgi:hypothetical protein
MSIIGDRRPYFLGQARDRGNQIDGRCAEVADGQLCCCLNFRTSRPEADVGGIKDLFQTAFEFLGMILEDAWTRSSRLFGLLNRQISMFSAAIGSFSALIAATISPNSSVRRGPSGCHSDSTTACHF